MPVFVSALTDILIIDGKWHFAQYRLEDDHWRMIDFPIYSGGNNKVMLQCVSCTRMYSCEK